MQSHFVGAIALHHALVGSSAAEKRDKHHQHIYADECERNAHTASQTRVGKEILQGTEEAALLRRFLVGSIILRGIGSHRLLSLILYLFTIVNFLCHNK